MRKAIVAGNWKMHPSTGDAVALAVEVHRALEASNAVETVLCPPFTALESVGRALRDGPVKLGAQNVHWESGGAYTGEVSASMLRDLGCRYVIVGHSERRTHFQETDRSVNLKAKALLGEGLRPIVCVGETLAQREAGQTEAVVRDQIKGTLAGLVEELRETVIAYEPVWAIGTGRTASAEQAQEVHALIRSVIADLAGDEIAGTIRIQYGGSVKPDNARAIFGQSDVDGGLIGGASLQAASFVDIVHAAA